MFYIINNNNKTFHNWSKAENRFGNLVRLKIWVDYEF